jgi:hypothetical protein
MKLSRESKTDTPLAGRLATTCPNAMHLAEDN